MKNLIIINGTMGVGKTTVSRILQEKLPNCVFLDGDWCWDMKPFLVNDETKKMVVTNIQFLLNQFLNCSVYQNIVFCWVMQEQHILDDVLSGLDLSESELHCFSLTCSEYALKERISRDVDRGIRTEDVLDRSLARLANYRKMNTVLIDTSDIPASLAADQIKKKIESDTGGSKYGKTI